MILLAVLGCTPDKPPSAAAAVATVAALRTAPVERVKHRRTVELTGSLEPIASVQLGFDVPGRVERLLVARGDRVTAGQAVARLDARMAEAQLAQAAAALAGAEAQVAGAESGYERSKKLREAGAMSDQQFTDVEAGIRSARAGLDQARAAVQLARTHLANHTLKSPVGGVVTGAPDNAGVMVGAGTPMFFIEDLSALRLKGSAPEASGWVREGLPAEVRSGPPGAEVAQPAKVATVLPALDPTSRRLPVEVLIDPVGTLRAHAFARVVVSDDVEVEAAKVPRAALIARPDFCVFVNGPQGPTRVPVTVLDDRGDAVLLAGDLPEGTTVVLDPPPTLTGG